MADSAMEVLMVEPLPSASFNVKNAPGTTLDVSLPAGASMPVTVVAGAGDVVRYVRHLAIGGSFGTATPGDYSGGTLPALVNGKPIRRVRVASVYMVAVGCSFAAPTKITLQVGVDGGGGSLTRVYAAFPVVADSPGDAVLLSEHFDGYIEVGADDSNGGRQFAVSMESQNVTAGGSVSSGVIIEAIYE